MTTEKLIERARCCPQLNETEDPNWENCCNCPHMFDDCTDLNILGVKWKLILTTPTNDDRLENAAGITDDTIKEMVVDNTKNYSPENGTKKHIESYIKKVMRHEIIHAFLCESGLAENSDWATNEELVDWIAIQAPKLIKAWKDADAL